jgi:hypothetical protein
VIQVGAGIAPEHRKTSRYNRDIVIADNLFRTFSPLPLLSLYSVDGVTFRGNRLERTQAYPVTRGESGLFDVTDSDRVVLHEPLEVPPSKP